MFSIQGEGLSGQGLQWEKNSNLEMLSGLDQQLQSISVCGPIELKLCRDIHGT
jgi:hypothetical protein